MGKVALIVDEKTASSLQLVQASNIRIVKGEDGAVESFKTISEEQAYSLVIVTEQVFKWIQPQMVKMRSEHPIVVSVLEKAGVEAELNLLSELAKRVAGVNLKL